jgi:hypothetical protein
MFIYFDLLGKKYFPVSVDLRVSRIYRYIAESPSFGGPTAPQLAALQTMEMPLDGDNTKDS